MSYVDFAGFHLLTFTPPQLTQLPQLSHQAECLKFITPRSVEVMQTRSMRDKRHRRNPRFCQPHQPTPPTHIINPHHPHQPHHVLSHLCTLNPSPSLFPIKWLE